MVNRLQLQLFYHLCRNEIICATTVHNDLAYPVLGFASSLEKSGSLDRTLHLLLWCQKNFSHHQRSSAFSILCLNIPPLFFGDVSLSTLFLLIWTFIIFLSILSTREAFYYSTSSSSFTSSTRKNVVINIISSLISILPSLSSILPFI